MNLKINKLHLATAAVTLSLSPMAVMGAVVEVTISNHSSAPVSSVGATAQGFPSLLRPAESRTFSVITAFSSSWIHATYASGRISGGCKFLAEHREDSMGPNYSSSAASYGEVQSSSCYVYLTEKWSKPYNYKVKFMIF
jgi:hypothetical protein